MRFIIPLLQILIMLLLSAAGPVAAGTAFEYPCYLVDAYDPQGEGFYGMAEDGHWWPLVPADPNKWLVGQPPTMYTAVALPTDHWVELQFRGPITDGPGHDIEIIEWGRRGEKTLVFLTDGRDQEYLLNLVAADDSGGQNRSFIHIDMAGLTLPFEPRAIRILGLDTGGDCPGFDLASVTARISADCTGYAACNPIPVDGAKNVSCKTTLSWSQGVSAKKHIVHFGTSPTDIPQATQPQDPNTLDIGPLGLSRTYYWRVDEVNAAAPDKPHIGAVWTFTTTGSLTIDNFEPYNDFQPRIFDNWIPSSEAFIRCAVSPEPIHAGRQSMRFGYYYDELFYSEAKRNLDPLQDWLSAGAKFIELYFHGKSDNDTGAQMYLTISDGSKSATILYAGDPNNLAVERWQPWRIDLSTITNLNLDKIKDLTIGFKYKSSLPRVIGSGVVFFDDIKVYPSTCLPESRQPSDFDNNCIVDRRDLRELTDSWLDRGLYTLPVAGPNAPVLWYRFDGDAADSAGTYPGKINGAPTFIEGVFGQAIKFNGTADSVSIVRAVYLFAAIHDAITITFWQRGDDSPHHTDTICCSNYQYGVTNPTIAVNLGCWKTPGRYFWHCGSPWSFDNQIAGRHAYPAHWTGRWNHWAFTKDIRSATMRVYLNGVLIDSRADANAPISDITSFEIGSGWYGGYDGLLDDFRIYDYALSTPEIANVATDGTGIFRFPLLSSFDLVNDDIIDFRDFSILAEGWLENSLWP